MESNGIYGGFIALFLENCFALVAKCGYQISNLHSVIYNPLSDGSNTTARNIHSATWIFWGCSGQ